MRVLLPLAVLLGACRSSTAPSDALHVSVAAAATVRAGQPLSVEVTVTNAGPTTIGFSQSGCYPIFQIQDSQGVVVGPGGVLCAGVGHSRVLAPGAAAVLHETWTAGVAPGPYTLRGWVAVGNGDEFVKSAPISLSVIP